jgi:hypothetical protein
VFADVIYFHPDLIFEGKDGAFLSDFDRGQAPRLAQKYDASVDVSDSDKHTRLPRVGINFDAKWQIKLEYLILGKQH